LLHRQSWPKFPAGGFATTAGVAGIADLAVLEYLGQRRPSAAH
jgi:hypothetical protein